MDEFDRHDEETSKSITVSLLVISFILLIGLSCSLFFISREKRLFDNESKSLEVKNLEEEVEINNQLEEIKLINEEIEINKNVEQLTIELKEEFPSLLKELEENIILKKSDKKIAYLTFDSGPYLLTEKFLDVLDDYNVQASFSLMKKDEGFDEETQKKYDEIYKRIISEGHTVINYVEYDSDSFIQEVVDNNNFFKNKYNYSTNIIKYKYDFDSLEEEKDKIIQSIIDNNYGYLETNSSTSNKDEDMDYLQSIKNVIETTNNRNFLVIRMYDNEETDLKALPRIIELLMEKGYELLPLSYESTMVNKK